MSLHKQIPPSVRAGLGFLPLLAVVLLFVLPARTLAQRPSALRGQVTDQLGAAVAGASITLIDSRGKELSTVTDDRGLYRFNALAAGAYTLRAVAPGFADYEKTGMTLSDGQTEALDFSLKATAQSQKVTVTGEKIGRAHV